MLVANEWEYGGDVLKRSIEDQLMKSQLMSQESADKQMIINEYGTAEMWPGIGRDDYDRYHELTSKQYGKMWKLRIMQQEVDAAKQKLADAGGTDEKLQKKIDKMLIKRDFEQKEYQNTMQEKNICRTILSRRKMGTPKSRAEADKLKELMISGKSRNPAKRQMEGIMRGVSKLVKQEQQGSMVAVAAGQSEGQMWDKAKEHMLSHE